MVEDSMAKYLLLEIKKLIINNFITNIYIYIYIYSFVEKMIYH